MYRQLIRWIVVGFAAVPPHAFAAEESVAASSEASVPAIGQALGESTVISGAEAAQAGTKATVAYLGPELSSTLVVGTTAVLATATTYMQWKEAETRRRYREAAVDGLQRLARGEQTPIANADEDSSLRLVAELERSAYPDIVQFPEYVSEGNVVRLIVARAKLLE